MSRAARRALYYDVYFVERDGEVWELVHYPDGVIAQRKTTLWELLEKFRQIRDGSPTPSHVFLVNPHDPQLGVRDAHIECALAMANGVADFVRLVNALYVGGQR